MLRNRPTGRGSTPPDSFEFDRTLSPSDSKTELRASSSGLAAAVVVRDNTIQPAVPDESFREKPTVRDLDLARPVAAVTPSAASEYLPPQPTPNASLHKTIETELVQLDPEVHPRTAQTLMNARRRARVAIDPGQVPTKPMPIQARRATRRRVARAVAAAVCLGAGGLFAIVFQQASWGQGSAADRTQVHASQTATGETKTRQTSSERPTLAIDVLSDLGPSKPASRGQDQKPRGPASHDDQEIGARAAAHLSSPWAEQDQSSDAASGQKSPQKRAVWLE